MNRREFVKGRHAGPDGLPRSMAKSSVARPEEAVKSGESSIRSLWVTDVTRRYVRQSRHGVTQGEQLQLLIACRCPTSIRGGGPTRASACKTPHRAGYGTERTPEVPNTAPTTGCPDTYGSLTNNSHLHDVVWRSRRHGGVGMVNVTIFA
jgi:hypothetical protein